MDEESSIRLERSPDALWRETLDGVLVLAAGRDEPVYISWPGNVLWTLLETRSTVDQLVVDLSTLFDADPDVVRADVEPVLATLREVGAVRTVTPNEAT